MWGTMKKRGQSEKPILLGPVKFDKVTKIYSTANYTSDIMYVLAEKRKAQSERRPANLAEIPTIKELLPKRRLTGREFGILNITDQCQRVCQNRAGKEVKPLITDTKYALLRRKVKEVSLYLDDYNEYTRAAEMLYIQEQWARSVYRGFVLKVMELQHILELVALAETNTQKPKKQKYNDYGGTKYTLKNIVDDRPEAALRYTSRSSLIQINKDIYFIEGYNRYLQAIAKKLEVAALNAITINTEAVLQSIGSYNGDLIRLKKYLIQDKRSKEELQILDDIFPSIIYSMTDEIKNKRLQAEVEAERLIDNGNIFTKGLSNLVFFLFTDDEASETL